MPTQLDVRQLISRDVLDQIAVSAGAELDNILRSLNNNVTAPLSMSSVGTNLVVNIASITVTNPETSKNRTIPGISNTIPAFASGTVTAPATGAGNITVSAGSPLTIAMTANQFLKVGINLNSAGNIVLTAGAAGASLATATAPASVSNTFGLGFVVLRTNGSNTMQNILNSDLYQYVGGGGGSGSANTNSITQTAHGFAVGDLLYHTGSAYAKAVATSAAASSVVGMVSATSDANNFTLTTAGLVTGLSPATLTVGSDYFLSTTAGGYSLTEPTVIGQVSAPIGIAASTSSMYIAIKRGIVVGGVNARTTINLTNNATTTVQNASAFDSGELTGWVSISATTPLRFFVRAPFAKNGLNNNYNISPSYVGDNVPVGFSTTITAAGLIQMTLPNIAGYTLATVNFSLNAPAVGATFPLQVDAANITGLPASSGRNYLNDWYDASRVISTVTDGLTDVLTTSDRTVNKTTWGSSDITKLTIARSVTTPLRETYSYTITAASTLVGTFIESPLFSLDRADLGKPVSVSFDLSGNTTDGHYQAYICRYNAANILQERVAIAGNAASVTPFSAKLPTGTTQLNGFFVSTSTSTDQYSLRIQSANVSAVTIQIDTVFVGPQPVRVGAAITDWQSYTCTPTNLGTGSGTTLAFWRRSGDHVEIRINFTCGTAGSGASTVTFSLPTGLTIDSTKVTNGAMIGEARSSTTASETWATFNTGTSSTALIVTTNSGYFTGAGVTAGALLDIEARVPVVGWSSNVTMADRAVEEYAWNSDVTSTASITNTGFSNGPTGVAFSSSWTTNVVFTRRIRFTTPILATDKVQLEVNYLGRGWVPFEQFFPRLRQSGTFYGAEIQPISGTPTDADIAFLGGGYEASNATYGGNGTTFNNLSSYLWRVRKVSGGAQVGYPISSANLIGRTDGNAPATGYVGQKFDGVVTATSGTASGTAKDAAKITALPSGTWMLFGKAYMFSSTANVMTGAKASISTTTNTHEATTQVGNTLGTSCSEVLLSPCPRYVTVPAGSTQDFFLVVSATLLSGTLSTDSSGSGLFYAIRIA